METFTVGMPDESLDESVVCSKNLPRLRSSGSGTNYCQWRSHPDEELDESNLASFESC